MENLHILPSANISIMKNSIGKTSIWLPQTKSKKLHSFILMPHAKGFPNNNVLNVTQKSVCNNNNSQKITKTAAPLFCFGFFQFCVFRSVYACGGVTGAAGWQTCETAEQEAIMKGTDFDSSMQITVVPIRLHLDFQ